MQFTVQLESKMLNEEDCLFFLINTLRSRLKQNQHFNWMSKVILLFSKLVLHYFFFFGLGLNEDFPLDIIQGVISVYNIK